VGDALCGSGVQGLLPQIAGGSDGSVGLSGERFLWDVMGIDGGALEAMNLSSVICMSPVIL
jgi:hypothetical protein